MPRNASKNGVQTRSNPKRTPMLTTSRAFGQKSPIVDKDIQTFLAICMSSWDSYTEAEKRGIIHSLPLSRQPFTSTSTSNLSSNTESAHQNSQLPNGTDAEAQGWTLQPLSPDFIASDTYLKRAIARFKRDVTDGYYEKTWQDKAKRAQSERNDGKFDEYLQQCADVMFLPHEEDIHESEEDEFKSDEDFILSTGKGNKRQRMTKTLSSRSRG